MAQADTLKDTLKPKAKKKKKEPFFKIDPIEFYPNFIPNMWKDVPQIGTLHVYVENLDMDIRGIKVLSSEKGKYMFFFPTQKGIDEDGKEVEYPIFDFIKYKKDWIKAIREKGTLFMKRKDNLYRVKYS